MLLKTRTILLISTMISLLFFTILWCVYNMPTIGQRQHRGIHNMYNVYTTPSIDSSSSSSSSSSNSSGSSSSRSVQRHTPETQRARELEREQESMFPSGISNETISAPRRGGGGRQDPTPPETPIYTVISPDLEYFADAGCKAGSRKGTLPYGAFLVATTLIGGTLHISFPITGYICGSDRVSTVEHYVKEGQKNGGIQSNHICPLPSATGSPAASDTEPVWEAGKLILGSCTLSRNSEWTKQWNIGHHGLGAMVGGRYSWEVIPVSVTDFYRQSIADMKGNKMKAAKPDYARGNRAAYNAIRNIKLHGDRNDKVKAGAALKNLKGIGEGNFEYITDLTLAFSPPSAKVAMGASSWGPYRAASVPPVHGEVLNGNRRLAIEHLKKAVIDMSKYFDQHTHLFHDRWAGIAPFLTTKKSLRPGTGGGQVQRDSVPPDSRGNHVSYLNMGSGVASQFHRVGRVLHHRAWRVLEGGILQGKMRCTRTNSDGKKGGDQENPSGCMDVAVSLYREQGRKAHEKSGDVDLFALNAKPYRGTYQERGYTAFKLGRGLKQNKHALIPSTFVCMIVLCYDGKGAMGNNKGADPKKKGGGLYNDEYMYDDGSLVCHNTDAVEVYLGVKKEDSFSAYARNDQNQGNANTKILQRLEKACWQGVEATIREKDLREKKASMYFQKHMSAVSLTLPTSLSGSRQSGKSSLKDSSATTLTKHMYDLGRYLTISSSSSHVMNLQGLWADGLASIWNGDYHININMQMMYWHIQQSGLSDVALPPLITFLAKMRQRGKTTALQYFHHTREDGGVSDQGWVSMAFTDGYMDTGLAAEYHWGFCVTCGAWMLTALYDHLSFSSPSSTLYHTALLEFLESSQGVKHFFDSHLVEKEGVLHTGPTTSPENCYATFSPVVTKNETGDVSKDGSGDPGERSPLRGYKAEGLHRVQIGGGSGPNGSQGGKYEYHYQYMAMSPAFDLSVLRNLAMAYSNAATLYYDAAIKDTPKLGGDEGTMGSLDALKGINIEMHRQEAASLLQKVQQMINGGVPVVQPQTEQIYEYPFYADFLANPQGKEVSVGVEGLHEEPDSGHRHFSSLHWVYPAAFLPLQYSLDANRNSDITTYASLNGNGNGNNTSIDVKYIAIHDVLQQPLYKAAVNTLGTKLADLGGHTSWSAAWQGALSARLHQVADSWQALKRILMLYSTPRLLSLHPRMIMSRGAACHTCFRDAKLPPRDWQWQWSRVNSNHSDIIQYHVTHASSDSSCPRAGIKTRAGGMFQLDGNLGFVAALHEMAIQSHIPSLIHLLPSAPLQWATPGSKGGSLEGVTTRGGIRVSLWWTEDFKEVRSRLVVAEAHPWIVSNEVHILLRGGTQVMKVKSPTSKCMKEKLGDKGEYLRLIVMHYPCTIEIST